MGSPALEVKGILTTEAVLCAKATQPPDAHSPLNCEARPHGGMRCKPRTMGSPPQKVNFGPHDVGTSRQKCAPKFLRSRAGSCTQRGLPEKLSVCREEANIRLPVPDYGQVTRDTERGIPNGGSSHEPSQRLRKLASEFFTPQICEVSSVTPLCHETVASFCTKKHRGISTVNIF